VSIIEHSNAVSAGMAIQREGLSPSASLRSELDLWIVGWLHEEKKNFYGEERGGSWCKASRPLDMWVFTRIFNFSPPSTIAQYYTKLL
jgi:hypothetical protein